MECRSSFWFIWVYVFLLARTLSQLILLLEVLVANCQWLVSFILNSDSVAWSEPQHQLPLSFIFYLFPFIESNIPKLAGNLNAYSILTYKHDDILATEPARTNHNHTEEKKAVVSSSTKTLYIYTINSTASDHPGTQCMNPPWSWTWSAAPWTVAHAGVAAEHRCWGRGRWLGSRLEGAVRRSCWRPTPGPSSPAGGPGHPGRSSAGSQCSGHPSHPFHPCRCDPHPACSPIQPEWLNRVARKRICNKNNKEDLLSVPSCSDSKHFITALGWQLITMMTITKQMKLPMQQVYSR